jgi:hypothetical protein
MDLQTIRNLVRTHLDLELEDLPDPLLDAFIREGSRRIEQAERYWPFYQQSFPYSIAVAEASTPLSAISPDITEIAAVTRSDGQHLRFLGPHEFEDRRFASQSGDVAFFTQWGTVVSWGPAPDAAVDLIVRGYRRPLDWVAQGAGAEPDLPVELHNTVSLWAIHRAYAQQEDPELSQLHERLFADELNLYRRRFTQMNVTQPIVLGGNHQNLVLRPPVYDWAL